LEIWLTIPLLSIISILEKLIPSILLTIYQKMDYFFQILLTKHFAFYYQKSLGDLTLPFGVGLIPIINSCEPLPNSFTLEEVM